MIKKVSLVVFLCLTLSVNAQTNTTNLGVNSGTQGNNNTFIGTRSGQNVTTNTNTFVGSRTGENVASGANSFFGSLSGLLTTTGGSNSFFGTNSGRDNVTGNANSFFGVNAGRLNTEGRNNNFFGTNAGNANTLGVNNVYIGTSAGRYNESGNSNVFVGHTAGAGPNDLSAENRIRNAFVGALAGRDATGNANVFIGYQAGMTETGNNKLHINNLDSRTPLVYGDFALGQLGINTSTLTADMALSVGGNTYVEGQIFSNGKISIGTTDDDPDYDFTVKGKIHVQEVKVDLLGAIAPDYVFYDDYNLKPLSEVEEFININGHLPNIPSADEMQKEGVNLKEMNLKLLEKIEELTLYSIQQKKELENQRLEKEVLEKRLSKLESILIKE